MLCSVSNAKGRKYAHTLEMIQVRAVEVAVGACWPPYGCAACLVQAPVSNPCLPSKTSCKQSRGNVLHRTDARFKLIFLQLWASHPQAQSKCLM